MMNLGKIIGQQADGSQIPKVYCEYCGAERENTVKLSSGLVIKMPPKFCYCPGAIKKREEQEKIREEEERAKAESKASEALQQLYGNSMIGGRFLDRTFRNYKCENEQQHKAFKLALDYAKNFEKYQAKGKGLLLLGKPGTGKTHLATAIAHGIIHSGKSVILGAVTTLLAKIRDSYEDGGENEFRLINRLVKADLLIIDDLGKENARRNSDGWSWTHEKLYEVINRRYEDYKPIVVTTNLDMPTLEKRTDPAIVSRLTEMCIGVSCNWEDYRKKI